MSTDSCRLAAVSCCAVCKRPHADALLTYVKSLHPGGSFEAKDNNKKKLQFKLILKEYNSVQKVKRWLVANIVDYSFQIAILNEQRNKM